MKKLLLKHHLGCCTNNSSQIVLSIILSLSIAASGCGTASTNANSNSTTIGISKHPKADKFSRGKLKSFPSYNENSDELFQVDLRGHDVSKLDLKDKLKDLIHADFDSNTKWPNSLPEDFNPQKIMEIGKNPGLNIKELHKKGITGQNIGIAIIDQELLVDHEEYKDRLKHYEEIHCNSNHAEMHGPAVASIAVGKNIGVAPQADLYYIAEIHGIHKGGKFEFDFTYLAKSINRVLDINKILPQDKKIRVISISAGWDKTQKGANEVNEAIGKAKAQGIFVISSNLSETYDFKFHGLGRNPLRSPDDFKSYTPGSWWSKNFYNNTEQLKIDETLLVPMDSRTIASFTGNNDYCFSNGGGWSWSIPYIAGTYALACQVRPDITPEEFWSEALKTGEIIDINKDDKNYKLGKILNPVKLIEALQNNKK